MKSKAASDSRGLLGCSSRSTESRGPRVIGGSLLFLIVAWVGGVAGAGPLFSPARLDIPVGSRPASIVAGDFNRDGNLDMATANNGSDDITVSMGRGDGTMGQVASYPSGDRPDLLVAGDLDGDGVTDLVCSNFHGMAILMGVGDGTFYPARFVETPVGYPEMVLADLDGDGVLDLGVGGAELILLYGNGDGTFEPYVSLGFLKTGRPAAGDLDGDGLDDLVFPKRTGNYHPTADTLGVLLSNGDRTFTDMSSYNPDPMESIVAVSDLNLDGVPDLVGGVPVPGTNYERIAVRLGQGGGTFAPPTFYGAPYRGSPWVGSVVDLDRDGEKDLALTSSGGLSNASHGVTILKGLGFGKFSEPEFTWTGNPSSLATGDMNRDSLPDVVVADRTNDMASLLLGVGGGRLGVADFFYSSSSPDGAAPAAVVGDFNLDGADDFVLSTISGLNILFGDGAGSLSAPYPITLGYRPGGVALGDLDGDRLLDLVTVSSVGHAVLTGNGDGTFMPMEQTQPGGQQVLVRDLNADDRQDLVIVNQNDNQLAILIADTTGFREPEIYTVSGGPRSVVASDWNLDGHLDLVALRSQDIAVLLGAGDGTLGEPAVIAAPTRALGVAVGDIDQDGAPDLAMPDPDSDKVYILFGRGDGGVDASVAVDVGKSPGRVVIHDLTGDGALDIAVICGVFTTTAGNVSVVPGRGDRTFMPRELYGAGRGYWMAARDLNGDNVSDLALAASRSERSTDHGIYVLAGTGDARVPVMLTGFTTSVRQRDVLISWSTGEEGNISGFHVLRADVPFRDRATTITGLLIPPGRHEYSYLDEAVRPGRYWYWLREVSRTGDVTHYGPAEARVTPGPQPTCLLQNAPNPFTTATEIRFTLQAAGPVSLDIFDLSGRLVRSLLENEYCSAGGASLRWDGHREDGKPVASGIYFYRLTTKDAVVTRKLHRIH